MVQITDYPRPDRADGKSVIRGRRLPAKFRHGMMDTASTTGGATKTRRSGGMARIVATLAVMAASPASATAPRPLEEPLTPSHPTCHARGFDAAELAAHPNRRVAAIALERTARDLAAERKWGLLEQFDDTPVISATLKVRLRGDPVAHSAHLECVQGDENTLICTTPNCDAGEIRIVSEGGKAITVSVGGTLKSGRFIDHYIHLDDSCEGRAGGPVVLESGDDERRFSLPPAPQQACR
jgi:hypothetical protein